MANTLMFEVGIKSAQEQLNKIKQEFTSANDELSKLLKIKVSIDGVDQISRALSQIGNTESLRNLRSEIAALNREFSILSKGAGGSGNIADRGFAADIERMSQKIERYTAKIKELTEERSRLYGGSRNSNYQPLTDEILRWTASLEGAKSKLAELNEQKNKPVVGDSLKKSTQDAQQFESALGRIETAISGLKSGMSVNLSGDFAKWAQEVQNVTTAIRELVGQLQAMNLTREQGEAKSSTQAQTKQIEEQIQSVLKETEAYRQLARMREEAASYERRSGYRSGTMGFSSTDNFFGAIDSFIRYGRESHGYDNGSYFEDIQRRIQSTTMTAKELASEMETFKQKFSSIPGVDEQKRYDRILNEYKVVLDAMERVKKEEQKIRSGASQPAPEGSVFDSKKFVTLQEAIDKIIGEINRLQQAFTRLGENSSLSNLSTQVNGLAITLSSLSNAVKFTGSSEEIAAYEAKVKGLKETIIQLEQRAKQVNDAVANVGKGIVTQAEKKGTESVLADNLQRLNSAIRDVKTQYDRLNEAYGQAQQMSMPQNQAIEKRLYLLHSLILHMEQLAKAASQAGTAEAEALSKTRAFSFQTFEGNQLFSKENTRLYSAKEINAYIKAIEDYLKTEARMSQTTGAATNTIAEIGTALGRAAERASQAGSAFSQSEAGIRNFAINIETARLAYDKTLRGISALESRISAAQKANMDKETIDFMNGLKQRAQQWADSLKKLLGSDMKGNPAYRDFLSMSSTILTSPQSGNMFQTLLGSDWKILMKNIGDTFNMLMKFSGFSKNLTLDNTTLANWLKGEESIRRLENALKDLNRQWTATDQSAKTPDLTAKYEAQKRAIESLIAQIKGAMTEESLMANRNGLADLLGVGFKNAVGYDNTRLIQEMRAKSSAVEKEEKEITRQIEREDKERQRIYERSEKERQALIEQTAKRIRDIEASITRGKASGRDMSALETSLSIMRGQSSLLGKTMPDDPAFKKRMKDLKVLIDDTEMLRKAEDKLTAAQERHNKAKQTADNKSLKDEIKSVNDAWVKYNELSAKVKEFEALRERGIKANIDVSQIDNAIAKYQDLIKLMGDIINNAGRAANGNLTSELLGGAGAKKMFLDANTDIKSYTKSLLEAEKRMKNAATAANNLDKKIQDVEARKVDFKGMDTSRLDAGLAQLKNIKNELESFSKTGQSAFGTNAGDIAKKMGLAGANKEIKDSLSQLNGQLRQNERDAKNAANATNQLSDAEQRLAHAIKGSSDAMKSQTNILSDLKMMATQYLGVWGAQQFVHNIIQIGGQLEQQRLSIGAILGDMSAGQHLFDQIKNLALTSPFGVMELDKDTKQLSAYGFKQSELFDMTKRLADISAGAGTEVSRLALALGHVRSEGALTGYTLRQFAMNNIPMLQKLSERLTKIEGQIVSTSEIRKRVSNKEIGYEDVIAVIKDLTNEGGMFFNMQETMADAVNAKFKNLKDSMDIMYGEMAEGGIGNALKKVAETLMFLTRNWEETARIVGYGTAAWVAYRVALTSVNTQMMTYGSTLGTTMKTLNAKAISLGINTAAVKRLTASEIEEMVTLKLITREQLLNAVATKTLTVDQAELAAATFNVSRAELVSISTKGKLGLATTGLGLRMKSLALSIRGVGMALKTMLLNPVGIALMAITGVFEVFMRWKQHNDEVKRSIEDLGRKGSEGYRNLAAAAEKYSGMNGKMSESEYSTAIDDILDQLKNYAPNIHNIQEEVQGIDNLADRYQYLRSELESTRNAYADLERTKSLASNANEATGNWLNDTFTDNAGEYIEKVQDVEKAEEALMQHRIGIEKALEELRKSYAFQYRTDANGERLPLIEQLKYIKSTDWNKVFSPLLYQNSLGGANALSDYLSSVRRMEEQMRDEVMPDLQNFANRLNNSYSGRFGENWKENADHVKTAWMAVVSEIDKVPGMTDTVKRELLEKIFNETWHLNIDFSTGEVENKLTGWRLEMQEWLDANHLNLKIGFNDSPEDVAKKAKAMQETAQTQMDNAGKVLIGIGFKLDNLPNELPAPLKTPWNQHNFEQYPERKATDDLLDKFKEHFHLNWETKKDKADKKKSGRQEDKELKAASTRLEETKSFLSEYKKFREVYGKERAIDMLEVLFPDVKGKGQKIVDDYKSVLNEIKNSLNLNTEERKKFGISIDKLVADTDLTEAKEKIDRQIREMEQYISDSFEQYNLFQSLLEKTGDREFAMSAFSSGKVWDAAATNMANILKEKMGDKGGIIDWDADKQSSEDWFKQNFENGEELYKIWEKIVDLISGNYKNALTEAADAMKDSMTYDERIAAIRAKYKEKNKNALTDKQRYANQRAEESEIASVNLDRLKDEMNWDAVFGSLQTQTKKSLIEVRRNLREYLKLNRQTMGVDQIKDVETAITNLNKAISDKEGLFGGLANSMEEYTTAVEELTKAQKDYDDAVNKYGANSIQAQTARGKLNQAKNQVQTTRTALDEEGIARMEKLSTLSQSLANLGKKGGASIAEVGGVISTLITTLGKTNTAVGNLISAIFSLAESIGNDPKGFAENIGKSLGNAIYGVNSLLNINNNLNKTLDRWDGGNYPVRKFMIGVESLEWMKSADYTEYEKAKASYESLAQVWDELLAKKKSYLDKSWGTEAEQAAKEALSILQSEREITQILGRKRLEAGGSYWSHSLNYRMWQGSYGFEGQNWRDVAQEISHALGGVKFTGMEDMLEMNSEQLIWIKENYTGLWSQLDTDFKDYLEKLIEYGDSETEIVEKMKEKLTGWNTDNIKSEWAGLMETMDNGSDKLAENLEEKLKNAIINSMIDNLFTKKIQAMIDSVSVNDSYIDKNGNVKTHHRDANGNITDTDIASEFTQAEWAKLIEDSKSLADEVTAIRDMMKDTYGWTDSGTSSGASSSIKGITEQTADLLASYINAIRADVSVNRAMIAQYFPMYYAAITNGNASLSTISNHTDAIMRSNAVVAEKITNLDNSINGLKNKTWKVPMA